jgi:anti-sigma factor RsiW
MTHIPASQLALYSRGDLGFWCRHRVERHLAHCENCARVTGDFTRLQQALAASARELPPALNGRAWDRLASEMTANIRLGLSAGECVSVRPVLTRRPVMTFALAGLALLIVVAGLERPKAFDPQPDLRATRHMLTVTDPAGLDVVRTVNTRGDIGTRYVDDTGVTINVVYASGE